MNIQAYYGFTRLPFAKDIPPVSNGDISTQNNGMKSPLKIA